ncbi:cidABC operon transcriptional activator CidR [Brevibacillus migulae]|uniref:cidABC operon transcriptional activator CidR n=1 Tax=Brevibacillus migulae TaxID=1644114 RepID=UPI00106E399E|nr:LysR family transcriptional regulator [Brevibacillus migulae]
MDIRHLQYFVEVARSKSFTKAAESLYITQPTISKMIRNLEEELGVTLLDRVGKKVELTDAGMIIYEQAQQITQAFQNLTDQLQDVISVKKGRIRMGLPPMVGASFFPEVIGKFREQYPGVAIELVENGAKKGEEEVRHGSLDLGVVVLPTDEEEFHSFSFVKKVLKVIMHPSHPLAQRAAVSLAELAEESFLLFREDFALHDRVIEECISVGFRPHVVYESSQWDFIREMVAANLGIALLPETICEGMDPARIRVVSLVDPVIPWHLAMIWKKDRYLSFAAREWIRFTRKHMENKE